MSSSPKVIVVGGPDVDARLELMHSLKDDFRLSALGTLPTLDDKFSSEGFDYTSYNLTRGANPIKDLLAVVQLVQIFRRLKPQLVHTFDTKPSVWARLAARLARVPIVIGTLPGLGSLYNSDSFLNLLLRSIYQSLQSLACRLSDLTIFQNQDDAHQFIKIGIVSEQKAKVIPGSGVNTDIYAPAQITEAGVAQLRSELGIEPDEIVVTMVSRLIRTKGVLEFMAAAQEVKKLHPRTRFLLVGPEDNESLDRLTVEELNELKQNVTWTGARRDIPAVLALSNIFVLPSAYREGIPRVLLEAASMGLPIITTDTPGCKDVVENEVNGFLVPVNDISMLKKAIIHLVEQPELRQRFGQISRKKAVKRFDISVISNQIREVYQHFLTDTA